ncbi:SRPBCC family protein [Saccharopolyspora montiporae]|uniref:SRPBCC family protein n=1 Tax=Saccharopolyspora montiporae TaxID=2781240 RepID=UPI00351CB38C
MTWVTLDAVVRVQVQETVRATPEEFLGLVMDIERYAQVDKKINPVLWRRRDGDVVEFACRPKLAGLRQPKVVQYARLTPGRRIDIGLMPLPANRIAHALARFAASFECEAVEGGTRVVRTLEFQFTPPARWLLEPLFRRRLEDEVRAELRLAKHHLEDGRH